MKKFIVVAVLTVAAINFGATAAGSIVEPTSKIKTQQIEDILK